MLTRWLRISIIQYVYVFVLCNESSMVIGEQQERNGGEHLMLIVFVGSPVQCRNKVPDNGQLARWAALLNIAARIMLAMFYVVY